MNRLSIADLKAQKGNQVTENLEAIKGGNAGSCHGALSQMAEAGRILMDQAATTFARSVEIAKQTGGFIQ